MYETTYDSIHYSARIAKEISGRYFYVVATKDGQVLDTITLFPQEVIVSVLNILDHCFMDGQKQTANMIRNKLDHIL